MKYSTKKEQKGKNNNESIERGLSSRTVDYYTIFNLCRNQLDMPMYKVKYALLNGLLNGAFKSLENYGIDLNSNTFSIFYDTVSAKLSGSVEIEHEWTEKEYDAIMQIRSLNCE